MSADTAVYNFSAGLDLTRNNAMHLGHAYCRCANVPNSKDDIDPLLTSAVWSISDCSLRLGVHAESP